MKVLFWNRNIEIRHIIFSPSPHSIEHTYMLDPNFKVLAKRRNKKKVRILYMGQFRWRKGVDILLSAYSLLKKQNVELIIVGYGDVHESHHTYVQI